MNYNLTIIAGNLTADPELKQNQSGIPVTSFTVAVNRDYAKEGTQNVDYFEVIAYRSIAEFICKYFVKGRGIMITGQLRNNQYTDKYQNKRYKTEIIAEKARFTDNKPKTQTSDQSANAPTYHSNAPVFEEITSDDDLPF